MEETSHFVSLLNKRGHGFDERSDFKFPISARLMGFFLLKENNKSTVLSSNTVEELQMYLMHQDRKFCTLGKQFYFDLFIVH